MTACQKGLFIQVGVPGMMGVSKMKSLTLGGV